MKKSFRKAMISTICMLFVGVLSLTGVTYAWFTAGDSAEVNSFNVSVQSTTGSLLIATPNSDGALAFGGTITPVFANSSNRLRPVSTAGTLDASGNIQFYSAEIGSTIYDLTQIAALTGNTTAVDSNTTYSNWYAFDIYIDNTTGGDVQNVYLSQESAVANANDASKSALATRVAFVQHGSMALGSAPLTAPNGYNGTNSTAPVIFEPNAKSHTTAGIADFAAAKSADGTFYTNTDGKYSYKGINGVAGTLASDTNRFTGTNLTGVTTLEIGADTAIASVPQGHYAKVTVYVWLEGQDADCLNDVAGVDFSVALLLTTTKPVAASGDGQ